jgi:MFS family permease
MIAMNTAIVNVALPSISSDLRFSDASLVWVANAYLTTFAGFLLLGGRLGDLFGHRRLFLFGITLFTLASLGCGLAVSPRQLIAARALQGLGGAIALPVALSLIMNLFTDAPKRSKALGIYAFVMAGGGSMGLLLGGILTSALSWRWIFLVNVPIGASVYTLCLTMLPRGGCCLTRGRLDVAGAVTAASSLVLAVYAIINGNRAGWSSTPTLTILASAAVLLILFVGIEARVQTPLMPLGQCL